MRHSPRPLPSTKQMPVTHDLSSVKAIPVASSRPSSFKHYVFQHVLFVIILASSMSLQARTTRPPPIAMVRGNDELAIQVSG
jgi:hypothetical protein